MYIIEKNMHVMLYINAIHILLIDIYNIYIYNQHVINNVLHVLTANCWKLIKVYVYTKSEYYYGHL